jgi:hypothetical protein
VKGFGYRVGEAVVQDLRPIGAPEGAAMEAWAGAGFL